MAVRHYINTKERPIKYVAETGETLETREEQERETRQAVIACGLTPKLVEGITFSAGVAGNPQSYMTAYGDYMAKAAEADAKTPLD